MRRRQRGEAALPEHLRRFDWREWREPAPPDDPFPEYRTWYLGLCDWLAARRAWSAGHDVPLPQLPREPIPPPDPRPALLAASSTAPVSEEAGSGSQPQVNRARSEPRARPIKTH